MADARPGVLDRQHGVSAGRDFFVSVETFFQVAIGGADGDLAVESYGLRRIGYQIDDGFGDMDGRGLDIGQIRLELQLDGNIGTELPKLLEIN